MYHSIHAVFIISVNMRIALDRVRVRLLVRLQNGRAEMTVRHDGAEQGSSCKRVEQLSF